MFVEWRSARRGGDHGGIRAGVLGEGALAVVRGPREGGGSGVGVGAPADGVLHLARGHGAQVVAPSVAGGDGGPEVDDEGEDVEAEDQGDDPLEDGGGVDVAAQPGHAEADGQGELDDDEEQLYPEREAQDPVLAVF